MTAMKLSRFAFVLASLALAGTTVQAAQHRTLWATDTWSVQDLNPWLLTDNGISYPANIKGSPHDAWRSPSQHYYNSGAAMGIQLNPTGSGDIANTPADKLNYSICPLKQSFSLKIGQEKAVGFAMELASNFATPAMQTSSLSTSVLITQFWQGLRPPVSINLINDGHGNLKFQTWVLNEQTGSENSSVPIILNTTSLSKGNWNTFVMDVKLDPSGNGFVKIWFNNSQIVNWTGAVGYHKGFTNSGGGVAGDNCSCDIGLYRNHGQLTTMQVFFDAGTFGDTKNDVAP
jgi:hypothetical protein